jgi:hypothetical protein
MKEAWTLQVTAGVTVSSVAMLPSRASAESRGVRGPRCRGVNPTTIIASTGFKLLAPCCIWQRALRQSHRSTPKRLAKLASKMARCPVKLEVSVAIWMAIKRWPIVSQVCAGPLIAKQ